jgi:hypothetical protein
VESKANLWNYLIAVAADNQERACSYLLKELRGRADARPEHQLRQRFKQIVPFRDCSWGSDESHSFSDYLFAHWRLASTHGYLPQSHLTDFYRGLFHIDGLARRLSPSREVLTDSLHDARLITELEKVREMMSLEQLGDQANKYAVVMMDLPQSLDDALTLMAEGGARLQLQAPKGDGHYGQRNSTPLVIALLLVLASFVLLSDYFKDALGAGAGSGSAILFIALGALVLRVASRA